MNEAPSSSSPLYYECHITIDPVQGDALEGFHQLSNEFRFRVAKLLMQKGSELVPSNLDSFCTGHSKSFDDIVSRMNRLKDRLWAKGFYIRRYKIEAVLLDSRGSK